MSLTCDYFTFAVGLIMGTRLWYGFWDVEKDNDAAFDCRVDSVVREIGDRGKVCLSEPALTPSREPASDLVPLVPAPAPAPAADSDSIPAPAAVAVDLNTESSTMNPSIMALDRENLMHQIQQLSSQLATIDSAPNAMPSAHLPRVAPVPSSQPSAQLSELFYLERERERAERQAERQAEREAERKAERKAERQAERSRLERAERERVERAEMRLLFVFGVSTCTCGVGVAIVGAALLLKKV